VTTDRPFREQIVRYLTILDGLIDTFPCFAPNLLNVLWQQAATCQLTKSANSTEVSTNMKKGIKIQK
jgi:hypothetical protein